MKHDARPITRRLVSGAGAVLLLVMLAAVRAPVSSLGQLGPDDPLGYLQLGERLCAEARSPEQAHRALQVLALGLGLADRAGDDRLAASMCIALASAETDPAVRTDLWDLALLRDPTRSNAWSEHRGAAAVGNAPLRERAARCVYFARNSDYHEAADSWAQPGVRQLIRSTAADLGMDPAGLDELLTGMIQASADDPCRGRVFLRRAQDGQALRVVCPQHPRPIGAAPSDGALRQLLTIEAALLEPAGARAGGDGWSAAAYLGRTGAAREPTVSAVLGRYGVDPDKPVWRADAWSSVR